MINKTAAASAAAEEAQSGRRQHVINWTDPAEVMTEVLGLSGIEAAQRMVDGTIPVAPMAEILGIRALRVEPGHVVIGARPEEMVSNGMGAAHGGYTATLLDSAAWLALHSRCSQGQFCSTLQLNIHYIRMFPLGLREITCEGHVLSFNGTTAVAEAYLTDPRGNRLAHATTHSMVRTAGRS